MLPGLNLIRLLLLTGVSQASATLQYDYLNLYYCPKNTCLAVKEVKAGFVGPASAFVECRCEGKNNCSTSPEVWNPIYEQAITEADLVCRDEDEGTWTARICTMPTNYTLPETYKGENSTLFLARSCTCAKTDVATGTLEKSCALRELEAGISDLELSPFSTAPGDDLQDATKGEEHQHHSHSIDVEEDNDSELGAMEIGITLVVVFFIGVLLFLVYKVGIQQRQKNLDRTLAASKGKSREVDTLFTDQGSLYGTI
ncbi:hypothetical protein CYMTET_3061 [Cymbomonas tetramitiformis]|uniref:Uncharacterized protein n=1 Tax=Cymbomonas tetramitiformis TaxID=36881 RepID=A0AAE0H4G8_9CHLO|nr:hypothetical protein CYMTET_3061 [Cymbomonas tetramitiformis]